MFEKVEFCGTFRSYQQKILDETPSYISDGKINIVAAPGSGKTILGLELIRRFGKPCLILSPTTTIRDQWGKRFKESFKGGEVDGDCLSYDLHAPKAITSVTYQALYSAMEKVKCVGEEADCSDIDLSEFMKRTGIGTVCLDEAHHLQNEWQRALEKFVSAFKGEVKIISLTATPPYDASASEWKRYTAVCGEIDEEIFVPELVKQGTLCPHQDYIYFNFPDEEEEKEFEDYKKRAKDALDELGKSQLLKNACTFLTMRSADLGGWLGGSSDAIIALLRLFNHYGLTPDKKLCAFLGVKFGRKLDVKEAELAVNFLAFEEFLYEKERGEVIEIFKKRELSDRGKITLDLNEKLKRKLISSVGKLGGISKIAEFESRALGEKLRLLVLCDYIRKESVAGVGKEEKFDCLSVVSIFETLRKSCPLPCGAVSGSLVILPAECAERLAYYGVKFDFKKIEGTKYAQFFISGGNREKVNAVGKLFEEGKVCALVGTKSLLGEGWDSPCINTLILATFVGSFMLSNQMRGRAIRIDKRDPDKTANIWHLVTVQSGGDKDKINSCDFETLERRFDCFAAPSYSFDRIESGMGRITILEPPYDRGGIEKINKQTLEIAGNREELKRRWENALTISDKTFRCAEVPSDRQFPKFTFYNISRVFALCVLLAAVIVGLCCELYIITNIYANIILAFIAAVLAFFIGDILLNFVHKKFLKHSNPKKSIRNLTKSVLYTLKDMGKILSDCSLVVSSRDDTGTVITVRLNGATVREQELFSKTVADLFAPIEYPRYIIIPRGKLGYDYKCALACPEIFGTNRETVSLFTENLKSSTGRLSLVYTRSEKGRALFKKCRKKAYITFNSRMVEELFSNC